MPVRMEINGMLICKYIADFKALLPDGTYEWCDVKGLETDVFKLKHKLLKALHPEINLLIVGKKRKRPRKDEINSNRRHPRT